MTMRSKKGCLRYIVEGFFVLLPMFGQAQSGPVVIDKIIAKVDNYIIMKSDLEKAYINYLSRGELRNANAKCIILEQLVVNKMLVAKAEIDSVIVEDEEVQSNLRNRMDYMVSQIGSREEIEKYYKKSLEEIEANLFDDIKEQMTVQRMQQTILEDLAVTPAEVRKFFKKIPSDSLPFFSTEVSVAQIVIDPKPGKKQKDKVKKLMYELRGRILRGESFELLARQYSEDPGSASRGGQLPFYKRGELAPEFEATAMTLEEGELSMPVETQFGFHLIELQKKLGNRFQTRHILISAKSSPEDYMDAERYLDSLRTSIVNDSISFREAAKKYSDDQLTAPSGGFFTDMEQATRVSVEELDPTIFFALDTMQLGNITKPMEFQKADGSKAYRILYYKDKVPPHEATLRDDYQKISAAAKDDKQNRILSDWFEKAKDKVYIETDSEYDHCNLIAN